MTGPKDYREYFFNLPSNDDGNKLLDSFSEALSGDLTVKERIQIASKDQDNVSVCADAEQKVVVLHSVNNLGGSVRRPDDKIVGAVGMGSNPSGVVISTQSFCTTVKANGPGWTKLESCNTTEELEALKGFKEGQHHGSNVFLLAPFMVKSVVTAMSRDPLELILSSLRDGVKFDEDNPSFDENDSAEEESNNAGRDHAVALANFLWLIHTNKIPEIKFVVPEDDDLQVYLTNRNKNCLKLPASVSFTEDRRDQSDIFKQLTESISIQNESSIETNKLCRLDYERKLEKDSEKKDSMMKLHSSVQHTFLMAASENGEEKAEEIPESCKSFYNQDSVALSEQQFSFLLRALGLPDVSFAHGTIQSILAGNLLHNAPGSPSNLSVFSFYEKLKDGSENDSRLLLHVMARDGKKRSSNEIQKSLKQVVVAPTNFTEMKEQLVIFINVTKILFGNKSLLPASLREFYRALVRNTSKLKYKCNGDKFLPTKMLFALDEEVQRWLEDCMTTEDREDVDDSTIEDLTDIVRDVLKGRFYITLPDTFKMETENSQHVGTTSGTRSLKKQKLKDAANDDKGMIQNTEPNDDYKMLDGENYKQVFCGKNVCHRVEWDDDGTKMCPRFHSRFYCFDNCRHKASHVPKSQVPADKDAKYKQFLKKIRST